MDRRIKFRHLDAFSEIARAGSFKVAAERLNLTQPAISKTLKELEEILGVVVLHRSRSGVELTVQGEIFLQFAEQSTAALRHGLRSIQSLKNASTKLSIGALPSVASSLLPEAVSTFQSLNPDTMVEIHEGPHQDLTSRLRSGGLDLVIGRLGKPDTMVGLSFRQLYTEEVVVVAHPQSRAVAVRDPSELDGFRVLYPPKDSAIRPLTARYLIAKGVPLFRNRIETASSSFGHAVVRADPDTVWIISRGVVARDIAQGALVALDLDMTETRGAVGVMRRAEEVQSVAARSFSNFVSRMART
ncbi:pca operon transcription factor PcaQ [Sulfitobacter sp. M57]|nr:MULTISPECIES: pca operon transcription factor PcaQ [unclassified Sulfitobacter]MDF3434609.1 pca operon transcription factor PcaQ [Sulfitobacter sp. KE42]MDF3464147.1 pca operon transcription factor PcaQ [Sulfitobacter sp. Ks18]MDF3510804.1 pca operon transcription factor PcaQ [Sulfitobacter sp. M57]MDF3514703.1 pca operon transcription factor PcaQ [Sulfitobacter sp. M36]MDF3526656.1 pca operon transcription factor PcaQ [Sulfitobacter sp. S66]MDF3534257.1 pca operon transcription factor Pca